MYAFSTFYCFDCDSKLESRQVAASNLENLRCISEHPIKLPNNERYFVCNANDHEFIICDTCIAQQILFTNNNNNNNGNRINDIKHDDSPQTFDDNEELSHPALSSEFINYDDQFEEIPYDCRVSKKDIKEFIQETSTENIKSILEERKLKDQESQKMINLITPEPEMEQNNTYLSMITNNNNDDIQLESFNDIFSESDTNNNNNISTNKRERDTRDNNDSDSIGLSLEAFIPKETPKKKKKEKPFKKLCHVCGNTYENRFAWSGHFNQCNKLRLSKKRKREALNNNNDGSSTTQNKKRKLNNENYIKQKDGVYFKYEDNLNDKRVYLKFVLNSGGNEFDLPSFKYIVKNEWKCDKPIISADFQVPCGCNNDSLCINDDKCDCDSTYDYSGKITAKRISLIKKYDVVVQECNAFCGCGPNCMNRVVQKHETDIGLMVKQNNLYYIKKTNHKGWGLFANKVIQRGTFVCQYTGEIISEIEAENRGKLYDRSGCSYLWSQSYQEIDNSLHNHNHNNSSQNNNNNNNSNIYDSVSRALPTIDATHSGNASRFVNHSCNPNCVAMEVLTECQQQGIIPIIAFFAIKTIKIDKEITIDYKYDTTNNSTINNIKCLCGSKNCRNVKF